MAAGIRDGDATGARVSKPRAPVSRQLQLICVVSQIGHQTMRACLETPDTPFEYTTSTPITFGQAGINCCREAADKFGLTTSVDGVRTGKKRQRYDDSEPLPKDSVTEVVGPQLQSGLATGELAVEAVAC